MFVEEKILQENILSRDHIDEIYNLFVLITDNSQFKIIPLNFINVFHNISEKKNLNVDKETWNQIFIQIDYDKDGAISFQDFLRYIYTNLKIILGEVSEKFSLNKINYLTTYKERQNFHSINSTIFFKFVNIINPFKVVEAAKNFQPLYSKIFVDMNLNKNGDIKLVDPDMKFSLFRQSLEKLNENFTILEFANILNGLNNPDYQQMFQCVLNLNKILSPLKFVSNHFEIFNFVPIILIALNNLAVNGIIEKLFYFLENEIFLANLFVIRKILTIIKNILNISNLVIELHFYSKFNQMNHTKNLETEILNLKDFIENDVIPKIVARLNFFYEFDNFGIINSAFKISILIAKKNLNFANIIFSQTNFINSFFQKFESLTNSDSLIILNRIPLENFNLFHEMRKFMIYSILIALIVSQSKENSSNFYSMVSNVLNRLTMMAENLKNIFFTIPDALFQYYFLIFLAIITKRTNFDDKFFVSRAQEAVMKNFPILMKPFIFYIKNLLQTKFKKESIYVIVENKTLEYLDNVLDSNKNEEFLVSEFLEILEIIVEEHKGSLVTSNVLRDLIIYLQKLLRYYNQHTVRKVIYLCKELTDLKDSIVDNLIYEYEIFSLVCKASINYKIADAFFSDFYQISKIYYDTPMLGHAITFLTNILQSEVFSTSSRYIKNINIDNLSQVIELFNSLFNIWNTYSVNLGGTNVETNETNLNNIYALPQSMEISEEILIFEKYKDLTKLNLPKAILEFIKLCQNICIRFYNIDSNVNNTLSNSLSNWNNSHIVSPRKQFLITQSGDEINNISNNENLGKLNSYNNFNNFCSNSSSIDFLMYYLEMNSKELEEKYKKIEELNFAQAGEEIFYDECYDELFIYTQSNYESEKQLWTTFQFSGDDLVFSHVVSTIQKHYNTTLNFYYLDDSNKLSIRIKDENDFFEILNEIVLEAKTKKSETIDMKLFVDDAEKNGKIKYICNCVHCGKRFELDPKELDKETINLCGFCKDHFLQCIVNNISQNMTLNTFNNFRNSPNKNLSSYGNSYYYK